MQPTSLFIAEKLTPVFHEVFDDELVVDENTTAHDVEGWDSLANIRLMVSIEQAFNIRFSAAEIARLDKVGTLALLIQKKLALG